MFSPSDPRAATLYSDTQPVSLPLVCIMRDIRLNGTFPHITALPLYERDTALSHEIQFEGKTAFDEQREPGPYLLVPVSRPI